MEPLSALSDADLADAIVTWSGRIAAGEAELLVLIGEYDEREAWCGTGLLSCAHWLSWRTSLSPSAAREKVRVARALRALPLVQATFAAGRLSYSQVRAITRVATAEDQQMWVDAARSATGGQLERLTRGIRRVRKVEEDAEDPDLAAWRMRATKSYDDDGNAVYRIVLPAEAAAIVDAGLEAMRAELDRRSAAEDEAPGIGAAPSAPSAPSAHSDASAEAFCPQQRSATVPASSSDASAEATSPQPATMGEALVEMARRALEAQASTAPASARRNRSALTVQVDPLSGWGRLRDGELLPPTTLASLQQADPACGRMRRLTADDLRRHDLGRDQRLPSLALRELVGVLDGERCRFPGCTRRRKLHAHHVRYWAEGGHTDLDNLVLVCSRHHTLIHQRGFGVTLRSDRGLTVTTPEGVPLVHHPAVPWRPAAELDPERQIGSATLPPTHVVPRIDLSYAVMVLAQQAA